MLKSFQLESVFSPSIMVTTWAQLQPGWHVVVGSRGDAIGARTVTGHHSLGVSVDQVDVVQVLRPSSFFFPRLPLLFIFAPADDRPHSSYSS